MDIASIVGFIALATCFMVGIGQNIAIMLDAPSAIIVVGGTIAALLVSFPLSEVVNIPARSVGFILSPPADIDGAVEHKLERGIAMFGRAATYAQAMGWIGVLIGLIIMFKHGAFTDIERLSPGMAICLLTAFYGTVLAYGICIPIRTKLESHLSRPKVSQ